jgi:hypothetical protein
MKISANKYLGLAALMSVVSLGSLVASSSSAQENMGGGNENGRWAPEFHGRDAHAARRGFFLGICVGQTLAQQGISLPVPQPGESPSPDSTNEAAVKAAVESCRAEMHGTQASPSPSGEPTTTPSTTSSGDGTNPAPTSTTLPAPSNS